MIESADLDRIASDVRAAAEDAGAMIVDAILSIEPQSAPVAAMDGSNFAALVRHLKPRLVYLSMTPFDATECAEGVMEGASDAGTGFRKLIKASSSRNGESCRLVLSVMGDGVLHGTVEVTEWLEEFEANVEALVEAHHEATARDFELMQEAEKLKADAEEKKRLAPRIKKLVADPRFTAPKTSVAKKIALAETLFPDLDLTTIRKIVTRAGSELWLSSQ